MSLSNANIIARLQKDILPLQGFKPIVNRVATTIGLGPIEEAFPNETFPLAAVHEFFCSGTEDVAVTNGFISGVLSRIVKGGVSLWINPSKTIFPPGLTSFGIEPHKIIFVDLQKEKDILWTVEESLKCKGISTVVTEIPEISFTESRRLQLAVEQSGVTGFIVRCNPRNLTTACVSRWKITSMPSMLDDDMPGVGFPRWNVELIKVRNGKPGKWQIEWNAGEFKHIPSFKPVFKIEEHRIAG